jgi:hypothetical protein
VKDRGFQSLMKTGRPGYRLPSLQTVSRDVKSVFLKVRKRIAKTLQVGLSSDLRSTPMDNSPGLTRNMTEPSVSQPKAYVAVSVHFEQDGVPVSMLLDIVEVARSHSGLNLAAAFAKILEDFGISHKVSRYL